MRDIVIFLLILTGIYFAVGEWRGWYIGFPGQTPVVLYKKDHYARTPIRTIARSDMPLSITGQVRAGTVRIQVFYERPASFQTNLQGAPERMIHESTFTRGQRVLFNEIFDQGRGIYTIAMTYEGASGTFRFAHPSASEL
ncbi:hypothetical protein BH23DEI1_BH23DEI1_05740 [soil metagenome]|nr:hypothetical protein [Trueperaceae bacterium]